MNNLPREIVEHIIAFAHCDKFVLVSETPVYRWYPVEHPWGMGFGFYWIYDTPQGWWKYKDYVIEDDDEPGEWVPAGD